MKFKDFKKELARKREQEETMRELTVAQSLMACIALN